MNNTYYYNGAVSAEEYAALLSAAQGEAGALPAPAPGAPGCAAPCVCLCRSVPCPPPIQVEEDCCCRESFRAALGLLCDEELADLLDPDVAAFVTRNTIVGAASTTAVTASPGDNLTAPLSGGFRGVAMCSCDLLEVDGAVVVPGETTVTGLAAQRVNLCNLVAAVIQLAAVNAEGDLTAEEVAARNFRRVRRILSRRISPCGARANCGCGTAKGECGDGCCCVDGVLAALGTSCPSRRVSLAAGPLLLSGVNLIGAVGSVLVLANEDAQRIYFVCAGEVDVLA